jgi:hypothetical protein
MKPLLKLKPEPDGLGFIYGTADVGDGYLYRVNIMPPLPYWRGDIKMDGEFAPHATDWVVYLDGEEIARVRAREDLEAAILTFDGLKPLPKLNGE